MVALRVLLVVWVMGFFSKKLEASERDGTVITDENEFETNLDDEATIHEANDKKESAKKYFEEAEALTEQRNKFDLDVKDARTTDSKQNLPPEMVDQYQISKKYSAFNFEIMEFYRKAARLGHSEAKYRLASMLFTAANEFRTSEMRKGQKELQALKDSGNFLRIDILNREMNLFNVIGQPQDVFEVEKNKAGDLEVLDLVNQVQDGLIEGLNWMRDAADENISGAMFEIGVLYLNGHGLLSQNVTDGQRYLAAAAAAGHAQAATVLGRLFLHGRSSSNKSGAENVSTTKQIVLVKKNLKKASKYLKKGVRLNNADAMHMLGGLYCDGSGVKRNFTRCFKLMSKAHRRGHLVATHDLALMYHDGKGTKRNQTRFIELLQESANAGYSEAEYRIGMCYLKATHVEEDKDEATKWFERAAQKNHLHAIFNLGILAAQIKDYDKAHAYFYNGARRGFDEAQYNLGLLYEYGRGMKEPDLEKAIELYKVAHSQKHMGATQKLERLKVDL